MTITPQQLPTVYTVGGSPVFASGDSKQVPANTVMDVLRYEQDLAALSPGHQITPLNVLGISPDFQNGYIATWTAGIERKLGGANLERRICGHRRHQAARHGFPERILRRRRRPSRRTRSSIPPATLPAATDRSSVIDQPFAFLLPRPAGLRATEPDRVRPWLSGQLHVFEIDRRRQRGDRRLHLRSVRRGGADRAGRPVRRPPGQRDPRVSISSTLWRSASSRTCMPTARRSCGLWARPSPAGWQVLGIGTLANRPPLHRLFGRPTDRCGLDGHGPARSDRHAGALHQPHGARGLLRTGRQ